MYVPDFSHHAQLGAQMLTRGVLGLGSHGVLSKPQTGSRNNVAISRAQFAPKPFAFTFWSPTNMMARKACIVSFSMLLAARSGLAVPETPNSLPAASAAASGLLAAITNPNPLTEQQPATAAAAAGGVVAMAAALVAMPDALEAVWGAQGVASEARLNSSPTPVQQANAPTSEADLVPETSHSIMFPDATLKFESAASVQAFDGAELSCV